MRTAQDILNMCHEMTMPCDGKAIQLLSDLEGPKGTIPKGTTVKAVRITKNYNTTNITVADPTGKTALIQWVRGMPFPHRIEDK